MFREAKLSTCIFVYVKGPAAANRPFRVRTHPGKVVEDSSPSLALSTAEIPQYDPENFTIVSCSQSDWDFAVKIMDSGRMGRLGKFVTSFQGEVNETNERGKCLSKTPTAGPLILRGSNVCLYVLRDASQGEAIYLLEDQFFAGKSPDAKAFHSKQERVGFQRSAPQNNFRRIIGAWLPPRSYCFDTVSYIVNVRWTAGRTGCLFRLRDRCVSLRAATSRTSLRAGAAHVYFRRLTRLCNLSGVGAGACLGKSWINSASCGR